MASLLPGSFLGRYEILEQVGRGGMAVVFKAHDPLLNRDVAIKVLASYRLDDTEFLDRFSQEAHAIARLSHSNIVQVYDSGEDKGFAYIVTEYLPSGTLQDRTRRPMPVSEAIELLRPVADALDYAHSQGIIHRDVKPANVLMDVDDRPVLADFGLSKVMSEMSSITAPGVPIGTPEYMAPEQGLGRDADAKTDIYALAVIAYQMVVGRTPFHADTPVATLMAHVHQPVPLPDVDTHKLSPGLRAVLLKALAKNPEDRYNSASDLVTALTQASGIIDVEEDARFAAGATLQVTGYRYPEPPADSETELEETPFYRKPIAIAASGLTLVALVVITIVSVFAFGGGNDETPPVDEGVTPQPAATPETTSLPVAAPPIVLDTPTPQPTSTPTTSLAAALASFNETTAEIKERVAVLRALQPVQTIETDLETREELQAIAEGLFRRNFVRNQLFETEQLYEVLGLMDTQISLEQMTRDILFQQVVALFDDVSGKLYVLSDAAALGPQEKLAYASVYMAGLQQQLFDVSQIRSNSIENGNFDAQRAVTAFITGEVAQIQEAYATRHFSHEEVNQLTSPLPDNALRAAPNVVRRTVLMPQLEGADFIAVVFGATGGWNGVNQVYSNPPVSTEQILHPEKYLFNEKPILPELPDLTDALGRGWEIISENTMGEFLIRTYLEEGIEPGAASVAAKGWGGDRYVLLNGPAAQRVFALEVNWDSPREADEFFEAYKAYASLSTGVQSKSPNASSPQLIWAGVDKTILISKFDFRTLLIIADNESLARQTASAFPAF